jgi:alpha-ketoglutarate-dependent taurine dioxygenase
VIASWRKPGDSHPHQPRHDSIGDLIDRMIRPEIVYHHVWRKGDVLVIDDRGMMHRAHGDYDRSQSRVLWRIIVDAIVRGSSEPEWRGLSAGAPGV